MKPIPRTVYPSPEQIEERIAQREGEALGLCPGSDEHRAITEEIGKLRIYAETKRWLSKPNSPAPRELPGRVLAVASRRR